MILNRTKGIILKQHEYYKNTIQDRYKHDRKRQEHEMYTETTKQEEQHAQYNTIHELQNTNFPITLHLAYNINFLMTRRGGGTCHELDTGGKRET